MGQRLTVTFARNAPKGRHYDEGGHGLFLRVTPTGARMWGQRLRVNGRVREIGLGRFPDVSLAEARELATANWRAAREGRDPVTERRQERARARRMLTFAEAAERFLEERAPRYRDPRDRKRVGNAFRRHLFPVLGPEPLEAITSREVKQALKRVSRLAPETARKLRWQIGQVFDWAIDEGLVESNPARGLRLVPTGEGGEPRHHPALPFAEMPRLWRAVSASTSIAAPAMRFLILTLGRSKEVRGALWSEIDLEARLWIIPAERMKTKREHRVTLSRQALEVLEEARARSDGSGLVFPGMRHGRPLSDMTLSKMLKALHAEDVAAGGPGFTDPRQNGRVIVPHGLRSSFRDWTAERGYDRDMAELAISHEVGSAVERAYRRSAMVERRRAMLQAWADMLEGREEGGEIVPLAR